MKKSTTLDVSHERTYEIKVCFPSDKIFIFSLFSKQKCSYRKWSIERLYSNKQRSGISPAALIDLQINAPPLIRHSI